MNVKPARCRVAWVALAIAGLCGSAAPPRAGVFLRFPDPGDDPWDAVHKGHEAEIGDPDPPADEPTWRTGSIYPFASSTTANTKPAGEWNRYAITCAATPTSSASTIAK